MLNEPPKVIIPSDLLTLFSSLKSSNCWMGKPCESLIVCSRFFLPRSDAADDSTVVVGVAILAVVLVALAWDVSKWEVSRFIWEGLSFCSMEVSLRSPLLERLCSLSSKS